MKGPRWRLLLKIFVTSALPLYFPVDWFMYFSPIVRPITVVCYFVIFPIVLFFTEVTEHMKIASTLYWLDLLAISSCNDMTLVSSFFLFE